MSRVSLLVCSACGVIVLVPCSMSLMSSDFACVLGNYQRWGHPSDNNDDDDRPTGKQQQQSRQQNHRRQSRSGRNRCGTNSRFGGAHCQRTECVIQNHHNYHHINITRDGDNAVILDSRTYTQKNTIKFNNKKRKQQFSATLLCVAQMPLERKGNNEYTCIE